MGFLEICVEMFDIPSYALGASPGYRLFAFINLLVALFLVRHLQKP